MDASIAGAGGLGLLLDRARGGEDVLESLKGRGLSGSHHDQPKDHTH